jgi:DNA relaxase NicK
MSGFSLTVDWFRFTLPVASAQQVMDQLGGDFIKASSGFLGYSVAYLQTADTGGMIRIGTGKKANPREVHVDCSGGIVSRWAFEKLQSVSRWVVSQRGTFGRIDNALDDRKGVVSVEQVEQAVQAGQAVKRSKKWRKIVEGDDDRGLTTGHTLYLGSRQSNTLIRIYDKALEQRSKGVELSTPWVRWEVELKEERAHACGLALATMGETFYRQFVVGVLRSAVDFRDTNREAEPKERWAAAVLPWWQELTEGFAKARLLVQQTRKKLEDVKQWAARSLAPMLAVLEAAPGAGREWLELVIASGKHRWKGRHYELLERRDPGRVYVLKGAL